jgi:hypothetical protein
MSRSPPSRELIFTGGDRVFRFEVEDSGGAVTSARATIKVIAIARIGNPIRDENLLSPEECSGFGRRDAFDQLGTGDPEACVCNVGHLGDNCEIHPCNYRGILQFIDSDGVVTCGCSHKKFTGNDCAVACGGHGDYDATSDTCTCFPGWTARY